ncbi:MAG: hypothetical protein H0U91_13275 [Rubrobacter sp.]|nr:hypothetical protein [Rubrobacter sp.]
MDVDAVVEGLGRYLREFFGTVVRQGVDLDVGGCSDPEDVDTAIREGRAVMVVRMGSPGAY